MKTNNEIHEQPNLPDLEEVRSELSQIPGVVGVGVGFKEVGGKSTDDVSFRVYVTEKKKPGDLLPEHIVPAEIKGTKTDVTVVPVRKRLSDEKRYRPIKGGTKVRNGNCKTGCYDVVGTLGCLATLDADGSVVLLSNMHVLNTFGTSIGDEIGQPGKCCCCCFKDVIAHITNGKFGDNVDCAIAKIKSDVPLPTENIVRALGGKDPNGKELDGTIQGLAPIQQERGRATSLKVGDLVKKVGIITGLTEGRVKDVFLPAMDSVSGEILQDQIDIEPISGSKPFAKEGDSGAVVLTAKNEVAGLLWGGIDTIGTANEIRNVVSALKITIPKTLPAPSPGPSPSPPPSPSLIAGGTALGVRVNEEADLGEELAFERDLLRKFENEFMMTPKGATFIRVIKENLDEGLNLVNHNRQVMVTWRRKQGPAFLAAFAKSAGDPNYKVPKEVNGVSLETLLINMAVVLEEHGSDRLRQAINEHALDVFVYAKECDSLQDLLERMRRER
jgi:hypothetical protein